MRSEQRIQVIGGNARGHLRREEALQLGKPLHLGDLGGNTLLELAVQLLQLGGLRLDAVEQVLDPHQRAHAGEELRAIDRLAQEIVGARFEAVDALDFRIERRHEHDGQHRVPSIGAQPAKDLQAGHSRASRRRAESGPAVIDRPNPARPVRSTPSRPCTRAGRRSSASSRTLSSWSSTTRIRGALPATLARRRGRRFGRACDHPDDPRTRTSASPPRSTSATTQGTARA